MKKEINPLVLIQIADDKITASDKEIMKKIINLQYG